MGFLVGSGPQEPEEEDPEDCSERPARGHPLLGPSATD